MSYIFLAFYMFWAGALGEYLSAKYPDSSLYWVIMWSLLWPLRVGLLAVRMVSGGVK